MVSCALAVVGGRGLRGEWKSEKYKLSYTLDSFTTITTATGSATHVPIIISHDKTYSSSTA